jgi:RNA polymerase sigma-54 factor
MALEARLQQKLGQTLAMTPQLQQAIKLLQLNWVEFQQTLEKELLDNPTLEEVREKPSDEGETPKDASDSDGDKGETPPSDTDAAAPSEELPGQDSKVDWEGYLESFSDTRGTSTPRGTFDDEDRSAIDNVASDAHTLPEVIMEQARLASELKDTDGPIVSHIIGNLDRDGYLCSTDAEIAAATNQPITRVTEVIKVVQSFDPPGVVARDLRECLLIQLEHRGLLDSLAGRIVANHLDKLEKRKYDLIAKAENTTPELAYEAAESIRQLEPRPGRGYSEETPRYIVPDVYITRVDGEYVVTLNEDGLPRLRISNYYMGVMKNGDIENLPNKTYLNERLKAASWLIRSIHQRQQTILKVTNSIAKYQKGFLDYGVSKLKPLVLKDIADDIGMHESTISRVTSNKYVHTPQGVFELKYFFTTAIKGAEGDVSSSSVKERIKQIVAAEDPNSPISDQAIVEALAKENVDIARRTVAKYRESLGIQSSSKRKKPF